MSWNQLLTILRNAESLKSETEVACPSCGEPLRATVTGSLLCTYDGYEVK